MLSGGKKHAQDYQEKKYKWEQAEEEECCGNGLIASGGSLETVNMMQAMSLGASFLAL